MAVIYKNVSLISQLECGKTAVPGCGCVLKLSNLLGLLFYCLYYLPDVYLIATSILSFFILENLVQEQIDSSIYSYSQKEK